VIYRLRGEYTTLAGGGTASSLLVRTGDAPSRLRRRQLVARGLGLLDAAAQLIDGPLLLAHQRDERGNRGCLGFRPFRDQEPHLMCYGSGEERGVGNRGNCGSRGFLGFRGTLETVYVSRIEEGHAGGAALEPAHLGDLALLAPVAQAARGDAEPLGHLVGGEQGFRGFLGFLGCIVRHRFLVHARRIAQGHAPTTMPPNTCAILCPSFILVPVVSPMRDRGSLRPARRGKAADLLAAYVRTYAVEHESGLISARIHVQLRNSYA